MAIKPMASYLYLDEACSGVVCHAFAAGTACVYTGKEPGKEGANEDSVGLIPCGEAAGVLALADGMGGNVGGDRASQMVINEINQSVDGHCDPESSLREAILDGLEKANRNILAMGTGAATTIVALEIYQGSIRSFHAGDSMALVTGQRGKMKFQTISHSPVGYALESGLIPEHEAMTHDERHIISNVMGSVDMRLDIGPVVQLAKRDTVLVGSDGLYDNLTIEEIVGIIRCGPLPACAEQLVALCNARMAGEADDTLHKPDDTSFILYRMG